ncbi:MAG: PPC domain-containing DNA-binding protein [Candidatus Micrarchaeia archaeon]
MQSRKEKTGYWLMLGKGDDVVPSISEWARKNRIKGAQVWGVGAVTDAKLACYYPRSKKWKTMPFSSESYELLSFMGNINEDGLHAHVCISDSGFRVFGGHLISAKISVFGEFFILPTSKLGKKSVPSVGLRGISLEK